MNEKGAAMMDRKSAPAAFIDNGNAEPDERVHTDIALMHGQPSLFVHKHTALWDARVPAKYSLCERAIGAKWCGPRIPRSVYLPALCLLAEYSISHGVESIVLIYFSEEQQRSGNGFLIETTPQRNFPARVEFIGKVGSKDGYDLIGDIHSHPGSAFYSNMDQESFLYRDGLHCVFGFDAFPPSVCAKLVINGLEFEVEPSEVFEWPLYPAEWLDDLHLEVSTDGGLLRRTAQRLLAFRHKRRPE